MFKYFRHKYYDYLNRKWAARMHTVFTNADHGISIEHPSIDTIGKAIDSVRLAGFTPVIVTNYGWYTTNPEFINWYDPNTKYKDLIKGNFGTLLATTIINDAIFPVKQRFLQHKTACAVCAIDKWTYDKYFH